MDKNQHLMRRSQLEQRIGGGLFGDRNFYTTEEWRRNHEVMASLCASPYIQGRLEAGQGTTFEMTAALRKLFPGGKKDRIAIKSFLADVYTDLGHKVLPDPDQRHLEIHQVELGPDGMYATLPMGSDGGTGFGLAVRGRDGQLEMLKVLPDFSASRQWMTSLGLHSYRLDEEPRGLVLSGLWHGQWEPLSGEMDVRTATAALSEINRMNDRIAKLCALVEISTRVMRGEASPPRWKSSHAVSL